MTITQRIDAITHIAPERMAAKLPAPKSVKIELVGRCNLQCFMCGLRQRQAKPAPDMDLDFFKRITKEMREAGTEEIGCFYLGESTLNPDLLIGAVKYLKRELGMPYVFVTSNATMAMPRTVEALMQAGLDSLKWSVNFSDPEQYEAMAGVNGKWWRQAIIHIHKAWEIRQRGKYKTRLYASSIRFDGEQQARMEKFLGQAIRPFVDEHYWLPLYSMGSVATKLELQFGKRPTAGNIGRLDALVPPVPCWSAFNEGHVTARGSLSACCFDADERWVMGNLHEQGFMDAWNSDAFQRLRAAHLKARTEGDEALAGTACESCVAFR